MANDIAPPRTTKANSASNTSSGSSDSTSGGRGQASGSKRKSDEFKVEESSESGAVDGQIHRLEVYACLSSLYVTASANSWMSESRLSSGILGSPRLQEALAHL
jgi:hypothetical protein